VLGAGWPGDEVPIDLGRALANKALFRGESLKAGKKSRSCAIDPVISGAIAKGRQKRRDLVRLNAFVAANGTGFDGRPRQSSAAARLMSEIRRIVMPP
jgi:hypothetical protein